MKLIVIIVLFLINTNSFCFASNNIAIAMAELKAGKYSNAIELFNRMILLSNNISDLYYGRGLAFYHSNNFEAAINDFNSYINLSPNSSIGYMGVCLSYLGQAQRQDVTSDTRHKLINNTISIVNKIINTFPNNYGLVYINGLANFWLGNYKKAIENFDAIIKIFESKDEIANNDFNKNYLYYFISENQYWFLIYARGVSNYLADNYIEAKVDIQNCIDNGSLPDNYLSDCQKLLFLLNNYLK